MGQELGHPGQEFVVEHEMYGVYFEEWGLIPEGRALRGLFE